ncbi:unnamed protein product [Rangifer tarandus platyrhynchus]|uniref:Uncharacterized protein n=1 Tax=Rangifer tarandus platyrhynchus TaxID=3082113 RepID=A0AC59YHN7_RANTA
MVKGTEEQKRHPACPVVVGVEVDPGIGELARGPEKNGCAGEVARYGCPSPRIRSPAHEAGARGARQSGKKCGAPGCCQFFLDHRARYVFSCPKTCREFQVSWRCCLSGSPCGGTIPLVDKPGGSEFPGYWRTPRSLALPESGTAYPVKVGSETARARIDDDTLSCIPWKI